MATPNSESSPNARSANHPANRPASPSAPPDPTLLNCFTGSAISAAIGTALYYLTRSITQAFANKPLPTDNRIAANLAVAIRTLVVGMSTLATAIFAIAAVGLIALGIQILIKRFRQPSSD